MPVAAGQRNGPRVYRPVHSPRHSGLAELGAVSFAYAPDSGHDWVMQESIKSGTKIVAWTIAGAAVFKALVRPSATYHDFLDAWGDISKLWDWFKVLSEETALLWVLALFAAGVATHETWIPALRRAAGLSGARHKSSLPLSISSINAPAYRRYSGLQTKVHFSGPAGERVAEVDPPNLTIGEVFISNISLTRSVTLKIALAITDKDGKAHKLGGEGRNAFGMTLGRNDLATRAYEKTGGAPPNYIVSPVRIGPQETVHGALVFVINAFSGSGGPLDDQVIEYYVKGSTFAKSPEELFRYALEVEDVVSGVSISIPLPSTGYKGLD